MRRNHRGKIKPCIENKYALIDKLELSVPGQNRGLSVYGQKYVRACRSGATYSMQLWPAKIQLKEPILDLGKGRFKYMLWLVEGTSHHHKGSAFAKFPHLPKTPTTPTNFFSTCETRYPTAQHQQTPSRRPTTNRSQGKKNPCCIFWQTTDYLRITFFWLTLFWPNCTDGCQAYPHRQEVCYEFLQLSPPESKAPSPLPVSVRSKRRIVWIM